MTADENRPTGIKDNDEAPETIHAESEEESVTQATRLSARLIYEVIRRDGDEELSRPAMSLVWSGLAAGVLISMSVISQAVLHHNLPDADWAILVESLGYSVGFLVVILGRMQLFTENTITTVLPVISRRSMWCLNRTARLWGLVMTANVVGAMIAAGFLTLPGVVSPELYESLLAVARHAVEGDALTNFLRSMPAGVLIAAIVWIMPSAGGNSFFVILTLTWIMAAAGFAHIVAGSVEYGLILWNGETDVMTGLLRFFFPVLAGNITGGTAVFALMAWGQVRREVKQGTDI
ncbi:formate/nitrite transporter family protein [Maritimibacter sp. UBA3975]|uniref:formate/nitrite transporter family protein n=1 Tax=Maritimibacter sp. UBA3975 TaxID=1946833 RepID=UPI000C08F3E2|nr:formate/nitrite transporter family protein [Maritimibacter sp. UBA3975]MAM63004.1 transporter (formate/nitrite transporter family protein) [Maritimibacter sp.]|tara:strand:- start:5989 stop:6864 length:876 start_codon:yes stop_codon:yes gene_type:complete